MMNSLNIISSRVSAPSSRSSSLGSISGTENTGLAENIPGHIHDASEPAPTDGGLEPEQQQSRSSKETEDETSLLLSPGLQSAARRNRWHRITHYISDFLVNTLRWTISIFSMRRVFTSHSHNEEQGTFSLLAPFQGIGRLFPWSSQASTHSSTTASIRETKRHGSLKRIEGSNRSIMTMDESTMEVEEEKCDNQDTDNQHASSVNDSDDMASSPARRSIRIRLHNEGKVRQRKSRPSSSTQSNGAGALSDLSPAQIKSPTSAASMSITKYPRAPAPPRPLIPRRLPSYSLSEGPPGTLKTLILDLDETLIHSMAKGGRMSTGHMVEVKLNVPSMGPQHPILYYVHKRPFCDEFLRKVGRSLLSEDTLTSHQICKWYNLVVFTASVQEYADPVIDWLEQERKFFTGRYYRQHCTFRKGAFIKDLSSVEPDLSKVMILDNSPLSYMFHQGELLKLA